MHTTKVLKSTTPSYYCESCDYTCSNRSNFNKHCSTRKHANILNNTKNTQELSDVSPSSFGCNCGKKYKHKNNLYAHRKKCYVVLTDTEPKITASMFMKVLEDNKELRSLLCVQQDKSDKKQAELLEQMKEQQEQIKEQQKQMAELIPKVGSGNTTTNNNQRFNLQLFLNEKCKDAITWEDFMKSIEVGTDEFTSMTDSSLTEGVAKVICHGIQELGVYKRPIHCVDMKRKKMCIKEEDAWTHDEHSVNGTLHKANVAVREKYNKVLMQWEKAHPNWAENESETETYMRILSKVVGSMDEKKCAMEIARNAVIPKED